MRDYNIIIPSATGNNIRVCLEALKSKQPGWREKVLVYDNDPSDGVIEACKDYGVHRVIGGKGYYQRQEIQTLSSLLSCLDNPADKLNLIAVLRSPALSATEGSRLLPNTNPRPQTIGC